MQTFVDDPYSAIGRWFADPSAPAWIQAIGSIAAVVAAGALILAQHHLDRQAQKDQRKADYHERLVGLRALVDAAASLLGYFQDADANAFFVRVQMGALRELTEKVDVLKLRDSELISTWSLFVAGFAQLDELAQDYEKAYGPGPHKARHLVGTLNLLLDSANAVRKRLDALLVTADL